MNYAIERAARVLKDHSIDYRIDGSVLWAKNEWTDRERKYQFEWIQLPYLNTRTVYEWLGY